MQELGSTRFSAVSWVAMGRPRKPDKKIALSFRASPVLADRVDQFSTAMGVSLSEAVEHALGAFFDSGMARQSVLDMEAKRAAAFAVIDAETEAVAALRRVDPRALGFLRAHLEGETYRDMVAGSGTRAPEARDLVRDARAVLGGHYPVLLAKPELLNGLAPYRRRPESQATTGRSHRGRR